MHALEFKITALELRKQGLTFSEIISHLPRGISKSTLSYWCKEVRLAESQKLRINQISLEKLKLARQKALQNTHLLRVQNLQRIRYECTPLLPLVHDQRIAKIMLAMLYLGEGSKTRKGSLMFGNSDPSIIALFLGLLRLCYSVQENKFRCTVQCRADQDTNELRDFWSKKTGIKTKYFYPAQVDKRTLGKITKKENYKGVCRIDYFSSKIYNELIELGTLIASEYPSSGPVV